jgi:hypothetical protein
VVEGHPVGAPRTAVVADDGELVVPQRVHDLDLVTSDLPHAERRMIRRGRGLAAVAEAAQVGGDDREPL